MTAAAKTELVLAIHMTPGEQGYDGQPYGRFEAYVYAAKPGATYDEAPWACLDRYQSDYAGFAMHASYGHPRISNGGVYGFAYGYETGYGLLRSAAVARYAKTLARLDRAYDKRVKTCGRPESLGQEVVYLMLALGMTRAFVRVPAEVIARVGGGSYSRDWRPLDSMEDIQAYLNTQVREFREAHSGAQHAA
jgi:hypothetical protein